MPIHIDSDAAKKLGYDDVFAHGMLSMAYLGRLLTSWVPQEKIKTYRVRFTAVTPLHAEPSCTGRVTAIDDGIATVDITVTLVDGTVTLRGDAAIDIIVNNAGYSWGSVIQKMTDEQWDVILDVHLKAPFRILRAAQPVISAAVKKAKQAGESVPCRKVVKISSIAGLGGNAGQANYAAAKAGVTVTIEGREINIGVNPDVLAMMKHMIPLGRTGTPTEAAGSVYLLCIPESDYVSGQTLVCGGGFMF